MTDSNIQHADPTIDPNRSLPRTHAHPGRSKQAARLTHQTILLDADDTLWENNVYFEQAIAAFISYLDHRVHTPEEVREHLNRTERATIAAKGYGLKSFHQSLVTCFEQLSDGPITPERHDRIVSFTASIADHQIELLPGVATTLQDLSSRHRLVLVTKGDPAEQTHKLELSGLAPLFSAVEVLAEKHVRSLRRRHSPPRLRGGQHLDGRQQPRSDINPALAAGLHAVFIPHDYTWVLEHETVNQPPTGQQLLELPTFADLATHF